MAFSFPTVVLTTRTRQSLTWSFQGAVFSAQRPVRNTYRALYDNERSLGLMASAILRNGQISDNERFLRLVFGPSPQLQPMDSALLKALFCDPHRSSALKSLEDVFVTRAFSGQFVFSSEPIAT